MRSSCKAARRWQRIDYSDTEQHSQEASLPRAPVLAAADASYSGGPAPGLEASQSSLNKRLASAVGLDDEGPTDFKFFFSSARPVGVDEHADLAASVGAANAGASHKSAGSKPPPKSFEEAGSSVKWVRTDIRRSTDLIDGEAWIADFQRRLAATRASMGGSDMALRNRVLREMATVSPPGKKVRLATGQEVIFWFNVGAPGPPRSRVLVTGARCPHQGVCLLGGELMEVEDAVGVQHALSRCPRHNKAFDLQTGASSGNTETLKVYPCRFEYGHWYVGVELEIDTAAAAEDKCRNVDIASVMATLSVPPASPLTPEKSVAMQKDVTGSTDPGTIGGCAAARARKKMRAELKSSQSEGR